jgi:cation diffusion facilitator family transporter
MAHGGSTKVILTSLAANVGIALAKTAAALVTGSGSMLAEALHSFSDCANQVLLLIGNRKAQQPPSASHPMGHGRESYLWSFLVALMLFFGGGIVAIYEGVHKVMHPEPVERVGWAFLVLGLSLALEGASLAQCVAEVRKQTSGKASLAKSLRDTKDADLIVVTGENFAAVIGLSLAAVFLFVAWRTHNGVWDGLGSVAVGLGLIAVAFFLAQETKSLLLGESADPAIEAQVKGALREDPRLVALLRFVSIQQGPGEVVLALKVQAREGLTGTELIEAINQLEDRVRARCPEVKWQFVEPDIEA